MKVNSCVEPHLLHMCRLQHPTHFASFKQNLSLQIHKMTQNQLRCAKLMETFIVSQFWEFGNRVHSLGVKNMEFVFKVRPQPKSYGIFDLFRECSLQRKKSISVERFLCFDERSGSCQEMCSTPFQTSVQNNLEHQIFMRPREGWGLGKGLKWFIMTKTTGHAHESWYPKYIFQLNLRPE